MTQKGSDSMGINIPENESEGKAFEDKLKVSKPVKTKLRKTGEMDEYRNLTIGVGKLSDDVRTLISEEKTISSDK
jgi:hypothetical protein